jgi:HK97 family phage major capsid protein
VRLEHVREAVAKGHVETIEDPFQVRRPTGTGGRDAALFAVDRYRSKLTPETGDRLEQLVRHDDPTGIGGRYLRAVADPAYNSAFGKILANPTYAAYQMSGEEQAAVTRVADVQRERALYERALNLTGASGGFAVPFELDPSIMLSSAGTIDPMRQLARVTAIAVDEWRGVSSAGVTASFAAEATETTDNAPTLAQPTISTERAQAFIPFSIEVGMDWPTLHQEMGELLRDAKAVLEGTKFITGSGTADPQGILTGLSVSQRVQTAGIGAIAVGDVYALKQAVPARFLGSSSWVIHPNRLDSVYRLVAGGSTTEPQIMPEGRSGPLVGRPVAESSSMATASATGTKWAVVGDIRAAYRIVDRIGLQIELLPHLLGANRRPTGERGLYAYWRVGAGVHVANAVRYGEVL